VWRHIPGIAGAAVVFLCSLVCSSAQTAVSSSTEPVYRNGPYGYLLRLPPGVTYSRSVPPNPNHGIGLSLGDNKRLWVDASYTDSASTGDEAKLQTAGCQLEDRKSSPLGGHPAVVIRFSCPASPSGGSYYEVLILAVLRVGNRSPVDYQIGMRAGNRAALSRNMALFDKIVAGFSLEKSPQSPR